MFWRKKKTIQVTNTKPLYRTLFHWSERKIFRRVEGLFAFCWLALEIYAPSLEAIASGSALSSDYYEFVKLNILFLILLFCSTTTIVETKFVVLEKKSKEGDRWMSADEEGDYWGSGDTDLVQEYYE